MVDAIVWKSDHLELLDQRILPFETKYLKLVNPNQVAQAITNMVVRGAPAIGVTAAYGLVLAILEKPTDAFFQKACKVLAAARPTAVNLFDAIDHMKRKLGSIEALEKPFETALRIAMAYHADDLEKNKAIGCFGAEFLDGQRSVLTHCNAGALATSGWGTALGVVRQLHLDGRLNILYADETRPFLQGARLTVWECQQDEIPMKLVTDGMGGYLMSHGLVDCVVVGSDRIAANGDVANKIGTFMVAMAAKHHGIPFVVAAPTTTVDLNSPSGKDIPVEIRPAREITQFMDQPLTAQGVEVFNPAFDVTPAELVTAIITEQGIFQYPYAFGG